MKQDSKISDEIKGHKNKIQIKTQKSETKKKPINIFADDEFIWGLKLGDNYTIKIDFLTEIVADHWKANAQLNRVTCESEMNIAKDFEKDAEQSGKVLRNLQRVSKLEVLDVTK